ncbi:hypothetical protein AB0C77_19330 [Streptomyces sp. NPDC048629]|uniref:hypothetical protein n=1 Tax=Streptomyces sp. NPDC048629 TaxID=3154824 RepID=UPI00342D4A6A
MTLRRSLGTGPQDLAHIRAAEADLLDELPGVRLPDLDDMRARGVLSTHHPEQRSPRRALGGGVRPDEDSAEPTHPTESD